MRGHSPSGGVSYYVNPFWQSLLFLIWSTRKRKLRKRFWEHVSNRSVTKAWHVREVFEKVISMLTLRFIVLLTLDILISYHVTVGIWQDLISIIVPPRSTVARMFQIMFIC